MVLAFCHQLWKICALRLRVAGFVEWVVFGLVSPIAAIDGSIKAIDGQWRKTCFLG
jgi:hypothetical protein